MVSPLTLALEAARDGVPADRLLAEAHLLELGIAGHHVADDDRHLRDELPVLVFLGARLLYLDRIVVLPFLEVLLHPRERLLVLFLVVDAFLDAAENLALVHVLRCDAEIVLHEVDVDERARDAHRGSSD